MPVEDPYVIIGQVASVYYFAHFLIFLPILGQIEQFLVEL